MGIRMEALGDDGQWHEVPGVTSIELHEGEPEEADVLADLVVEVRVETTGWDEAVERARRVLELPRVIDQHGNPVQPHPNRPAWQSPYGPPSRRR